jgi:uncharacterized protein YciW
MKPDTIDEITSLKVHAALHQARHGRPEFVDGAEACRDAVITPVVDTGLGHPLRAALAARMARLNGHEKLAAHYRAVLVGYGKTAEMALIAEGGYPQHADGRLRAILRHTDFITLAPRACSRADTERLVGEGLSVPEVVALAELIGFLNFEVRIVVTLDLLKAQA